MKPTGRRNHYHPKGLQYEDYHHVKYTDAAIEAAANLSNRYIQSLPARQALGWTLRWDGSKMNLTLNFVDPKGTISV